MSALVDVLAVMDADRARMETSRLLTTTELRLHDAARDAVAELIESIGAFRGKRGAFMALGAKDDRTVRLWAALARVGGAA